MSWHEKVLLGWSVTLVGFGALFALAAALFLHHRRRSRVPAYARRALASVTEGPALLGGTVEAGGDASLGPVLAVDVLASPGSRPHTQARPFTLRLPTGVAIRVEPGEGQWWLDTLFAATELDGRTVYVASVEPGQVVYVSGAVRREIDPGVAGTGYRDVARTWVMRGELAFSSTSIVAAHAARARFHARWAAGLAVLALTTLRGFAIELGRGARLPVRYHSGYDGLVLGMMLIGVAALAYLLRADASSLWVQRSTARR